jgi:membrane-bound ClpP family serine protease
MNETVITYALYLLTAVPMTIWVARTLHKNGRVFLVECFHENEELADSVNHLLVVGFYLINIGFVALYLKVVQDVVAVRGVFEAFSAKIGVVMLVLGAMHFFNIYLFTRIRKRDDRRPAVPPVPPTYRTNPEAH